MCEDEQEQRVRKELEAHYFRSDLIVFKNFNMFRSSDLFMVITMMYISMQLFFDLHPAVYFAYVQAAVVCASDPFGMLTSVHVHICVWCVVCDCRQAVLWRCIHSFGLGYILYCQSCDNDFVRSYLERGSTLQDAFDNWKKYVSASAIKMRVLTPSKVHICRTILTDVPIVGFTTFR
jgi:phosphatidylethanolamine N-methyltransferase